MAEGAVSRSRSIRFDWRVAVTLAVIVIALHVLKWVLLPFLLAGIVAFLCEPVVRRLACLTKLPRWLMAVGVWLVLVATGMSIAIAASITIGREVSRLASHGPNLVKDTLVQSLGPGGLRVFGIQLTPDRIADELKEHVGAGLKLGSATQTGAALLAAVVGLVLFAVLSFYLILSGPQVARGAVWLVPPAQRSTVRELLPGMLTAVRRFYVGVLVIVVFTAVAAWVGYGLILHVPDAAAIALSLGVLETVPAIGPMVSAAIVAVVALQLHSPALLAFMVAYAIGLRLIIDDIVAPPVLGRSVALHPVVVMLAYAIGAVLFGVTGLLLAVPAAACIRIWLEAAYGDTPGSVTLGSIGAPTVFAAPPKRPHPK